MIVGKMIKEIRENAGLSQEEFAEKLAISRQAVSKWERGIALPDIENIMYISDLFNVSLDTIVKGDEKMTKKIISDNKKAKVFGNLFIGIIVLILAFNAYILCFVGGIINFPINPLAIFTIVFFPIIFQCIFYGKFTFTAFSIFFKNMNENEILKKAEDFFKNYAKVLWLTAILVLSINFVIILKFLETKEGLRNNLVFMANVIIATGFINLAIIVPFKIKIKENIIKIENEIKQ
jgi:transcriptional regulator with XRE-family HTH domain